MEELEFLSPEDASKAYELAAIGYKANPKLSQYTITAPDGTILYEGERVPLSKAVAMAWQHFKASKPPRIP